MNHLQDVLKRCDWPVSPFQFKDEPGEHDPCYIIMPGGAVIPLAHHALNGVDQARAQFIVEACNEKLARLSLQPVT
jgi:hypothetical protein